MNSEHHSCSLEQPIPGVYICQPEHGFRYGSESFWLVGFALQVCSPSTALDLGTGSGIMAMLLAAQGVHTLGIDAQSGWSAMWSRTLQLSSVSATLRVHDVVEPMEAQVDLVVCNPPFFPAGSGTLPADPLASNARFESTATLTDFVRTGAGCIRGSGRMCLVVPQGRETDVVEAGRLVSLSPARICRVGTSRSLIELAACGEETLRWTVDPRGSQTGDWYKIATTVDSMPCAR